MGRHPKPTAVLTMEKGKLYSDQRDRQEFEPQPDHDMEPICPERFGEAERKIWENLAEVLRNYGLFSAANAIQLELLTESWSQYVEAGKVLAKKTKGLLFISDGKGSFKENPIVRTQQRLRAEISVYSQNLGLSSVSMAKIGALMLRKKREKDEFFE